MRRIEELTLMYLDGALGPAGEQELDSLVADDAECASVHHELLRLDAELHGELLKMDAAGETMSILYGELANDTMQRVSVLPARKAIARQRPARRFWRIVRYAAGPLAAVIILCVGLQIRQNRLASGGVVVETQGNAMAGTTALHTGDAIPSSRVIQTTESSLLKFQYKDGSTVELGPNSTMQMNIASFGRNKRLHLSAGKLSCNIAPQESKMTIETMHATATVLGTIFEIDATPGATTLQVTDGAVLLQRAGAATGVVVRTGFRATASEETQITMSPMEIGRAAGPTGSATRTALFNGHDLEGWEITKGSWQVVDGTLVGYDSRGGSSRLESRKDYRRFELECQIRLDSNAWAEFQFQNYAQFFAIENATPSVWHELKVLVSGSVCQATLDGKALPVSVGEAAVAAEAGRLAFYVTAGKKVWIREVYVRELE
ncbi:MAG: hypothetical protein C0404_14180 [Verrucomicrobia bacterium]|nr:hypothetical protein [Verrucomicrobiota bacterium]